MIRLLEGIVPILATPFTNGGAVDYESLESLVDHLLEQGARGLGVFGNAGEGYALLASERREILSRVARRAGGRAPLCVGVGATGTAAAVEACREAERLGAAVLMVLPPYYLKPDAEGVAAFYAAVGAAVSVPIMVQDAPLLTGVNIPPALMARLAGASDAVRYAKVEAPPTAPKITAVREAAPELALLGGLNGLFMIEEITRGARGQMPAADMTALYVEVWNCLEAGDREAAWRSFRQALPLIRFELQPGLGVSAVKHNLLQRGVIRSAAVRPPTRSLDAAGLEELAELRRLVFSRSPA